MTHHSTDPDVGTDELWESLRIAAQRLDVRPAPLETVRARSRQRMRRRRAAVGVAATFLVVAGIATAAVSDQGGKPSLSVQAGGRQVETGHKSVPQALLFPGGLTGKQREERGLPPIQGWTQLDQISAAGARSPWWISTSDWGIGNGVILADGQRIGLAIGYGGTPLAGQHAIQEISDQGVVTDTFPLPDASKPAAKISTDFGIIGASATDVYLVKTPNHRLDPPYPTTPGTPGQGPSVIQVTGNAQVVAFDLATGTLRTLMPSLTGIAAAARDTLVTFPNPDCTIDVHDQLGTGATHTLDGPCLPGATHAAAESAVLSPDGRLVAVRWSLFPPVGQGDELLTVTDLHTGSTLYRYDSKSPLRPDSMAWTSARTLSVALPPAVARHIPTRGNGVQVQPVPFSFW